MAEQKPIPSTDLDASSMDGVLNVILSSFNVVRLPIEPLPPPLIMVGGKLRPGLSAESIAAEIISKQSDTGRIVGDVFADGPNVEEAMEVIRVKAVIDAILTDSKIEVVIPPGIGVYAVGIPSTPGTPVVSVGVTTTLGIGDAVIR